MMELQWSRRVVQRQQAGEVVILRDGHPTVGRELDAAPVEAGRALFEADPALARRRPYLGDDGVGLTVGMRRRGGEGRGAKPQAEENER